MVSSETNRLRRKFLVSVVLLLSSAAASYSLFLDLNSRSSVSLGETLAEVVSFEKRVRRRPAKTFVWSDLIGEQSLYRNDSLKVGEDSAATVKFRDGTVLEIGANSLVVIDQMKAIGLNFLQGDFVVRGPSGDRRVNAIQGGQAQFVDLTVRLQRPGLGETLVVTKKRATAVPFQWKWLTPAQGEYISLQVSRQKSFAKKRTVAVSKTTEKSELSLKPGKYYWRLANKRGEPISEARSFRVTRVEAIQGVWPNREAAVQTWGNESPVTFRWQSPELRAKGVHRLDVFDKKGRSKKTVKIHPKVERVQLAGLAPGVYRWKITSTYGEREIAGRAKPFKIKKAKDVDVSLLGPERGAIQKIDGPLDFHWEVPFVADFRYEVELEELKSTKRFFYKKTESASAFWDEPRAGSYRWRVRAMAGKAVAGKSKWRALSLYEGSPIALSAPDNRSDIKFWGKAPRFKFTWSDQALSGKGLSYRWRLAKDALFHHEVAKVVTKSPSLSSRKVKIPRGDFFWKVDLVHSSGTILKTSDVRQFYYGFPPILEAPTKLLPAAETEINVLMEKPRLSWKPVQDAQTYEVEFFRGGNSLWKRYTRRSNIVLGDIPNGSYEWTVRALDPADRLGKRAPFQTVHLTNGDTLRAPEILQPLLAPALK